MLRSGQRAVPFAIFNELLGEDTASVALDDLVDVLIAAYERALAEGAAPLTTIAAVLDWALAEMKKLQGPRRAGIPGTT